MIDASIFIPLESYLFSKKSGIVLALSCNQRKEEARGYALMMADESKRDDLLCWCLEGEEKKKHCQHLVNTKLYALLFQLDFEQSSIVEYTKHYLQQQMIAGRIVSASVESLKESNCCGILLDCICHEMIGVFRQEQIGDRNG